MPSASFNIPANNVDSNGQIAFVGATADFTFTINTPTNLAPGQQLIIINNTAYNGYYYNSVGDKFMLFPGDSREFNYIVNQSEWRMVGPTLAVKNMYFGDAIIPAWAASIG